jgi:hypothetical protein
MFIRQHRIYRVDLKANPHVLYVFGDNEKRIGFGGQAAEMRGEQNAVGIATLFAPGDYWSDRNFQHNCDVIVEDMVPLFRARAEGRTIVFPMDGVGTGLADLANQAPNTFSFLQRQLFALEARLP